MIIRLCKRVSYDYFVHFCFVAGDMEFYSFSVQIIYSLLFSIVIAFISDALSTAPDKVSVLSHDASFRHGFNETVRVLTYFIDISLCVI